MREKRRKTDDDDGGGRGGNNSERISFMFISERIVCACVEASIAP